MKKIRKFTTEKRYTIHYFTSGGFCYRSVSDCPWSCVKEARAWAKSCGTKVEVEYERTIKHEYSYYVKKKSK